MATIDNLSIQINANAEAAIAAINRTASSAERLRGAAKGAGDGLKDTADGAKDAATETQKVQTQTEKTRISLHGFWNALKQSGSYLGGAFLGGMKGIVGALGSMASGLLRIAKFRIYRTIVKDLGQSFKDLYGWSKMFGSEYANSMDRINSSFVYLRNSIASAAAPLFNALAPVLDAIIDKIVTLLNWLNQLFSALSGASTYTVAKKVEQSWVGASSNAASNAKKASDEIKRTILGFDEINKLSKESSNSSSGGGGSSPYTSGYQYMFEEKELAGGWKDFATAIENAMSDAFSRITMIVGGAELALGAILALSGANVPLGLGLMATGAVTLGSAIFANWEGISEEVKRAVAGVEAAVAGGLAVGAVLAFSGGNVGLGIGLMIAALSTGMGAATIAWNTIGDTMSEKVQAIATLVGGASFGIGAVLAFAGHPGIGIAMMIAGASVAEVSINWNFLKEKLEGPIGAVTALISGASLALGILALISGNIPIGLGLILAGTAGLATTVAANWDNLVNIGKTAIEKVKEGWETVKELVVTAWVELKKKVGEWASDVWEFITNGKETISKKISLIAGSITEFAGGIWDFALDAKETVFKKISLMAGSIAEFAGGIWDFVLDTKETVFKKISLMAGSIAEFAGGIWDFVLDTKETVFKKISLMAGSIAEFAGGIWDFVLDTKETVFKKISLIAGSIAEFAGDVWDFITGPDAVSKVVNAVFAFAQNAISDLWDSMSEAWTTFVKGKWLYVNAKATIDPEFGLDPTDPAYEDNVAKLKKLVQMALNTGEWNFPVDMTANFPEGSVEAAKAEFDRLWGEKNPTAPVTPTISDDSWQDEWDKLVGDEIDVKVKANVIKGTVEDSIKTWFDNAGGTITTTISTLLTKGGTWINEAWTALTTKSNNIDVQTTLTKNGWTSISDFVGTVVDVFARLSGQPAEGSSTLPGIFGTAFNVLANLTGKTDDSKGLLGVFGSYFTVLAKLTGATEKSLTLPGVFGSVFNVLSNLTGKEKGSLGLYGVYGSYFEVLAKLTGKTDKSKDLTASEGRAGIFDSWFRVDAKLDGKTGDSKDLKASSSRKGVFASFFTVLSKLTGKEKNSNGLNDVYGKTFTVTATLSSTINGLSDFVRTVADKLKEALKKIWEGIKGSGAATGGVIQNGRLTRFESGGIINNGFVRKLPHYAGGSTDAHGTLFVAGEAGPEILGHIGGRTEILNQSQLAATMFAAVRSAMGGVKIAATMYNGGGDNDEADYEMMYRAMYDAFTDAMTGSNERDKEKVQLMRQIAAKEFTAEVTANSMNRAQTRMNRRAGTTIVPVGT